MSGNGKLVGKCRALDSPVPSHLPGGGAVSRMALIVSRTAFCLIHVATCIRKGVLHVLVVHARLSFLCDAGVSAGESDEGAEELIWIGCLRLGGGEGLGLVVMIGNIHVS